MASSRLLKDPATAASRVFIGHLQTEEMNRNELEEHFSKYGSIVGSSLNRGFGFIQFENEQSAQDAIKSENGAMFKGRRIDVKPAKKDPAVGGGVGMGGFGGDNFNSGFGGGNQNFNSNSPFGNDNQFNRGGMGGLGMNSGSGGPGNFGGLGILGGPGGLQGSGGPGGNGSFNDQDNSFGNRNNDSFNPNKGNGPQLGGNKFGNQNQNNQGGPGMRTRGTRGGKNRKREGNMNERLGSGMDNQMADQFGDQFGDQMNDPFPDRIGGGIGDRLGGSIADRLGGGIGGGGIGGGGINDRLGDSLGRSLGSSLGSSFRSSLGGGVGSVLGSGLGAGLGSSLGGGLTGGLGSSLGSSLGPTSGASTGLGSSFRDRSPLGRAGRLDDKPLSSWDYNKSGIGGGPGAGGPRGGFGGGFGDHKSRYDDFKGPGPMRDAGPGFGPSSGPSDYPPMAPDKNDCEIIVVNKTLTDYAELIESHLKKLGLTVDLLFPNEDVPLTRVLGNIASRGCLYAIVIAPTNKEHHSLTLNILHGLPQEHRNMPVDDAINLVMRDFTNYKSGGRSVPANVPSALDRHPDAIQVLMNTLADNRQLTVLQYDRVIKYLEVRREEQVQIELGEDAKNLGSASLVNDPKQAELQSRILNILNSNKNNSGGPPPTTVTAAAPSPVPPPAVSTNITGSSSVTASSGVTPSPLLNDPSVQKALDNLLQGNLLKNIGEPSNPGASAAPIFAAFPNINRF